MQQVTRVTGKGFARARRQPSMRVKGIADERVTGRSHMNSNLVRPPRLDGDFDQRLPVAAVQNPHPAESLPASGTGGMNRSQARVKHRPYGNMNLETVPGGISPDECTINLGHRPVAKGLGKAGPSSGRECKEDDSRRAAPQAMHGDGLRMPFADQRKKSVIQIASCRNGGKAAWLLHDQELLVPAQNFIEEGHFRLMPRRAPPGEPLARLQRAVPVHWKIIEKNFALPQPLFPGFARRMAVFPAQVA